MSSPTPTIGSPERKAGGGSATDAALQRLLDGFLAVQRDVFSSDGASFTRAEQDELLSRATDVLLSTRATPPGTPIRGPSPPASPRGTKKPIRVYVDGCFDLMHSGHYNLLRQAKMLGDVLVAGVHSCAEIERNKGPPVLTDAERMRLVGACKWVDEVEFDTPYSPTVELLDRLNCDFIVHGDDLPTGSDGTGAYDEVQRAGRFRMVKRTEGVSTTNMVGRLLLMTKDQGRDPISDLARGDEPRLASEMNTATLPSAVAAALPSATTLKFLPTGRRIAQFSNCRAPTKDDEVVYICGDFDLFHIGHIQTLERARKAGTFLLVGVHSDATVQSVNGGDSNYPIMNQLERVLNVLACKWVDDVIIGAPHEVTQDLIKSFNVTTVISATNTSVAGQSEEDDRADP